MVDGALIPGSTGKLFRSVLVNKKYSRLTKKKKKKKGAPTQALRSLLWLRSVSITLLPTLKVEEKKKKKKSRD